MRITIETTVASTVAEAWSAWISPEDITAWNAASDEWCCPAAELALEPGGTFSYRMEARDGSMGFDFTGTFRQVRPMERIDYVLEDGRAVEVEFIPGDDAVTVRQTFEAENAHAAEQQREGWQAILDRFARHVESKGRSDRAV